LTVGAAHTTKVTWPELTPLRNVWNPPMLMAPEPTSRMVIWSTAEASATLRVRDDAALMSATLMVKTCEALPLPARVMAPPDTPAATPPAEHRDEATSSSSVLAAPKSMPVLSSTLP
jgi:hypothetical protein